MIENLEGSKHIIGTQAPDERRTFFRQDWINHNKDGVYYDPRQYLHISGVSLETIDTLYTPEGEWKYTFDIDPYSLSPEELLEKADEIMPPIYEAGHLSAARGVHELMNLHTWQEHGRNVARLALSLVKQAGYDISEQRRTVLAAFAHDMANIQTRGAHNEYGSKVAAKVFPKLKNDTQQFELIKKAAFLHNGASDAIVAGAKTTQERLALYAEHDTPASLAVRIADKIDNGRWRANTKSPALTKAFMETAKGEEKGEAGQRDHTLSNLLFSTTVAGFDESSGRFVWQVQFNPFISEEEMSVFNPDIVTQSEDGTGIYVPESLRTNPENAESLADFNKAVEVFNIVNGKRVRRAMDAALLLFKDQNIYGGSLIIQDSITGQEIVYNY